MPSPSRRARSHDGATLGDVQMSLAGLTARGPSTTSFLDTSAPGRIAPMTLTSRATKALVSPDWAQQNIGNPSVRFIEVDVDTDGLRPEPHPRRGGLELDQPAVRRIRRDIASRDDLQALLRAAGIARRHPHRPLRRQQQLVRGLGLLAAQDARPRQRQHHRRRPQELARPGPAADHGRIRPRCRHHHHRRARLHDSAPSATRSCRASASPASPSSTCAHRPSSPARSSPRRACPRRPSAAATSRARPTIPWAQAVKRRRHLQVRR